MTTKKTNAEAKSTWFVTWEGTSGVPGGPISCDFELPTVRELKIELHGGKYKKVGGAGVT
jgi:hypothetical protein